jgi:hypothetical protein
MQSVEMALPGGEVRQAYDMFRAAWGAVACEGEEEGQQEFDLHSQRR